MSNELFGNSPDVEAKEALFTDIFNQIAEQKFGEGDEIIKVREGHFSSDPEVTKTIAVQRILTNEELQKNIYEALEIEGRPRDSEMRYLITQGENNQFKLISIRTFVDDGKTYFEKAHDDEEVKDDRGFLTNIARNIKETLTSEVKRLEK